MAALKSIKIGLSVCMMPPDSNRKVFNGRSLLYVEESLPYYLQQLGACVSFISPVYSASTNLEASCQHLDGLVLHGGVDINPNAYGETAQHEDWLGNPIRDSYDLELVRIFRRQNKPILGICRGLQVLNVAFGGTLYQDIASQVPGSLKHRDALLYQNNSHAIDILPATSLAQIYSNTTKARVNSVHHQAIKDLAPGLIVNARSSVDGIIEAIEYPKIKSQDAFCMGVQWHPEFQASNQEQWLDPMALLQQFMAEMSLLVSN